jgi:Plant transposon protein
LEEEEERRPMPDLEDAVTAIGALRRMRKRKEWEDNGEIVQKKTKYKYQRARDCLYEDYLGPDPLFEKYFERVFRVTRRIVERLIQICGNGSGFFRHSRNKVTGEPGIYPECKVLIALKQLAYGTSSTAFMDYYQMSDTTARKSLKLFCEIISKSELKDVYRRRMTKADARRVSQLHEANFGVSGCVGCLDCFHVYWRLCPTSWKGQYEGKEGTPSLVLKAVADYNTWIWHAKFGFPGTLNNINIWDQSPLLKWNLHQQH